MAQSPNFPLANSRNGLVTVTEHGTWLSGPVEKTLWVRRNPDDTFLVFSATCPHMNCTVNLTPEKTFECPCHHSHFDAQGAVTSMPAPRPLDTLEYRVSGRGHAFRAVPELQEGPGDQGVCAFDVGEPR